MMATTLVFLAIFVPVAFMTGITGQIYKQFAVTIGFAVCFSLVVLHARLRRGSHRNSETQDTSVPALRRRSLRLLDGA